MANKIRGWGFMLFIVRIPTWEVWWFGEKDRVSRFWFYVPENARRRGLLKEEGFP
jgi:hypothetical protein